MPDPIATLDLCSAKLQQAQDTIAKTRRVAVVLSSVAVAGGFALLLYKIFGSEPESAASAPEEET